MLGTTRAHRIVEVVCAPPRRHWQAYWYVALFERTVIVAGSGQHKGCNGCRLTGSEGGMHGSGQFPTVGSIGSFLC